MNSSPVSAARLDSPMVDEMFDDGHAEMEIAGGQAEDSGASGGNCGGAAGGGAGGNPGSSLMNELNASDRTVHADFKKDFGIDFFDDKDLE